VGVDVPNATVMMVEGADRFGLAQLHQFRGRVGRGAAESYCLLLADDPSEASVRRLELVKSIRDGFKLALEDMRIRGMGELLGARQHGMSDEAMQALEQPALIDEIRAEVERVRETDPGFDGHALLKAAIIRRLEQTSIS
jgi:ATP-dependent DNA helicase RecG